MTNLNEELKVFLEQKPLYSGKKFELPEFVTEFDDLAREFGLGFPGLSQIEMECLTCKRSRPFGRQKAALRVGSKIYAFLFICHTCSSSEYTFFIEVDIKNGKIKKVGQNPSWLSINKIDKDIMNFLGDDADFFTNALICESQNYGIGAFSYYRRIVENSIEKILYNIRSFVEREGSSATMIAEIDKALNETIMDKRIKIAKNGIPESLRQNGINPLTTIYDTLSAGIHRFTEEECLKNCEAIRVALCHLIQKLPQQDEAQKAYINALKHLNNTNSKSS